MCCATPKYAWTRYDRSYVLLTCATFDELTPVDAEASTRAAAAAGCPGTYPAPPGLRVAACGLARICSMLAR